MTFTIKVLPLDFNLFMNLNQGKNDKRG